MNRIAITLLVGLVAIVLVGSTAFAVAAQGSDDPLPDQAAETASVQPGERLTGAIGVHEAELEGDLETRTFGLLIAQSATDAAKADVVADTLADNEARLAELEARMEELNAQREAGDITEGQYRAQVAIAATELGNVDRAANASQAAAGDLPVDLLEDRGINATAILELRERAHELSGQEVREIARSIAGNQTDTERGPPDEVPPGDRQDSPHDTTGSIGDDAETNETPGAMDDAGDTNETAEAMREAEAAIDAAEDRIFEFADRLDVIGLNESDGAYDEAQARLKEAQETLAEARAALDDENPDTAIERAEAALNLAEEAHELLDTAIESDG